MEWRKELRQSAQSNKRMQGQLLNACKQSFLYWVNAFVWTYRQKMAVPDGREIAISGQMANRPFITWPVQDEIVNGIFEAIENGDDVNLDKSRDMGATWVLMALADWLFLFTDHIHIGLVSRKEALVDTLGDMDSLFEKIRYINRMLPNWMLPVITPRFMHLHNKTRSSTIAGESTNTDVGRGGRKALYIVDEAAAIPNADSVEDALSQNTPCQIWVSTAHGPNTQFHKRIKEGRGKLMRMMWWRHPEKTVGASQVVDESGKIKWTSPWFARQESKYSRKTIAQELMGDHGSAGDMFFDFAELERHRMDHQKLPLFVGDLAETEPMTENQRATAIAEGRYDNISFILNYGRKPWRFWVPLEAGRPMQGIRYVFGLDIGNGSGDSNSVLTVLDLDSGQIVAKWWDSYTSPEELAIIAAHAGLWFGGPAFIIWENNGPGGIFGRKLVSKLHYPYYYRQRLDNTKNNKRTPRWGWHSNGARKEILLGMYRDAVSTDAIINPCQESLDEAADYVYSDNGELIPGKLREESFGGRALHGDHVVADALVVLGAEEWHKQRNPKGKPPQGSYAWRKEKQKRRLSENEAWKV